MQPALIISPDPESRRTFELACELLGLEVSTAIDPEHAPDGRYGALLLDMADDSPEQWDTARRVLSGLFKARADATAVILPRGRNDGSAAKTLERASLIIRRPFELMSVVGQLRNLAAGAAAPARAAKKPASKARSSRKSPPGKRRARATDKKKPSRKKAGL